MATLDDIERKLDRVLVLLEMGRPSQPSGGASNSGGGTIYKFGKLKGRPLAGSSARDLRWYGGVIAKSITDPTKSRYIDDNRALLGEINALLAGLGEAGIEAGEGEGFLPPPDRSAPSQGGFSADDDIPF